MKRLLVNILLITVLLTVTVPSYANPLPQSSGATTLVTVSTSGGPATGISNYPDLSADGRYITFSSSSPMLVAGDTNGQHDCFVRDMQTSQTTRVSVSSTGAQITDHGCSSPVISADGRFVAFSSYAGNLVDGDTNTRPDVFVHDRDTGQTTRASVTSAGAQVSGDSSLPAISADGRYVAFYSAASNLVADDTNGTLDIFVHDRLSGQTTRVSVNSAGEQADLASTNPDISSDGRYVVFASSAANLAPESTGGRWAFFLHDRQTAQTTYVAQSTTPSSPIGAQSARFSTDGNFIAFESYAQIAIEDANNTIDIYRYNRMTEDITLVSIAANGEASYLGGSVTPSISADGRYVTFGSSAPDLVAGDTNGVTDIFLRDIESGIMTRASVTSLGSQANGASEYPAISADGHYVAFSSVAANLAPSDPDGWRQIYLHEPLQSPGVYSLSGTVRVTGGKPLTGARVSDGQGHSALSGMDGSFLLANLVNGSHTITVEKRGYTFAVPSLAVNIAGGDVSGVDFTADLPQWTLIYVLDGDNDHDEVYRNVFNYLESGIGKPGVNVVALWDRLGSGNSAYYWMKPDSDLTAMATYTHGEETWPQGELNMGDPAVLGSFTSWAMDSFPASHYALILDDHGDGLAGILRDDTSASDRLTLKELQATLLQTTATRQRIDVLVANACLMGMVEDGYQFRDVASYYVASENRQQPFYTGYTNTLDAITQSDSPLTVAIAFADGYADEMMARGKSYTMAVADLSKVGALKAAIESLAGALSSDIENNAWPIFMIRNLKVRHFYPSYKNLTRFYIDLFDFARLVKEEFSDPEIQAAADGVMAAIQDNYIVHNRSSFSTAYGVSIFFPEMKSSYYDDRYDFSIGTTWDRTEGPDIQASIDSATPPQIWGNFLADVFHQVDPNGPDNPTPPELISKQEEFLVFLPMLRR